MAAPKPYPLQWPEEKPRTPVGERRHSNFGRLDWEKLLNDLQKEVDRLGGEHLVLSTNQPLTLAGRPSGENKAVIDPGVAVYFDLEGMPVRFGSDQWATVRENIRAVVLHLDSMRGQERWGVGTKRQAFSGYTGLMRVQVEDWRITLGLPRNAPVSRKDITEAYRELVKDVHPDRGGTPEAMNRLNEARDRALREISR